MAKRTSNSNRFNKRNNNSVLASHLFQQFLATTTTLNSLTRGFMEDFNTLQRISPFFSSDLLVNLGLDCSQSLIFPQDRRDRVLCDTGGHLGCNECQIYLGGGGRFGRRRENSPSIFLASLPHHYKPRRPPRYIRNQDGRLYRQGL